MNKAHQKRLYHQQDGLYVSDYVNSDEFQLVMNGDAYNEWDEDYYCLLEAIIVVEVYKQ